MSAKSNLSDTKSIIAVQAKLVPPMSCLSSEARIALLCGLLAQEICMLPVSERASELEGIIDDLPHIVRSTEQGMQEALVENARSGL